MAATLLGTILAILLALPVAAAPGTVVQERLSSWPQWRLPVTLPRPGRGDLIYPHWFAGAWEVTSHSLEGDTAAPAGPAQEPPLHYRVDFIADRRGRIVGARAANAAAIGRAVLGHRLVSVEDDPANPNRQLARLRDGSLLETRVIGRQVLTLPPDQLLADELSLQVLHGEAAPRVSRVEVLSHYQLEADGTIRGEQWLATYPSPTEGLMASPRSLAQYELRLVPLLPQSGPAS
ncbi:POLO box duplicated region [Synechococcus sp. CCY9201]|uniref:DUF6816 family protein n=1 Tax=unclassified Synechococcus TaxID=2626047 RepID=UPI002AD2E03B|nr:MULTISPECIES: POLO box duplicated region [unclassified Synechococcus]MEA5474694.1 POLO box duplicated region [Synechococcus sp. CCY9201]CAK6689833.1 hypothetical protein IFHNHDMJ_00687 [Synechococcus sp. CBW1107]